MRKWFILFIISILPYAAFADAVKIGSLWYNLDESTMTAEVTSSGGDSYSGDIVIPGSVTYGDVTYSVKSIGVRAFNDIPLTSVTIEDGIETIKEYAFWDSDGINELVLPKTLKVIGDEAFTWAYITSLVLPEGLDSIGRNAFCNCNNLKNLEIPSTITRIGDNVFGSCGNVSSVVSRIQTPFAISESVFSSCTSATLYVPAGTMTLYQKTAGWNKFDNVYDGEPKETTYEGLKYIYLVGSNNAIVVGRDDSEMRKITIPSTLPVDNVNYNVVYVAKNAFQGIGIDTLIISSGVEMIGRDAFNYCYNLKAVELPSTLKTIGDNAFYDCYNLKRIELPSSLDSIGNQAFFSCDNLAIVVSRIQTPLTISQSVFAMGSYGSYDNSGNWVNTYTPSSATLYVPNGTKTSYDATEGWKGMFADIIEGEPKEITYDGLNYIYVEGKGTATVVGMADTEKRKVVIPSTLPVGDVNYSVKTIGNGAFQNRTNIDTLIIQSGIETIGKNAFQYCRSMKSITLPEGVKTIGEYAFNENGTWSNGLKKIVLPSSLDSIGNYAFYSCNNLSAVVSKIQTPFTISQSVFGIGSNGSYDNSGNWVYTYTPSPAILYVPDGTKASYDATEGWKGMFADIIEGEPKEITYDGLNYIYVEGNGNATVVGMADTDIRKVIIPSTLPVGDVNYNVKTIATGAFQNRTNIDTLIIQSGIETIGKNAFQYCYNMKSITIPEGVKTIGENAFSENGTWNNGLRMITLPSSLDSIGNYAFNYCSNLTSIVSKIQNPFAISETVFRSSTSATLYVPIGTATTYQQTTGWNKFAEIVEGELKETTYEGLNYTYVEGKGTATVVGRADTEMRKISIPSTLPVGSVNYSVKAIARGAFRDCNIDTLIIASGVETIGYDAFNYCWNLKKIELPSTLKTIADQAFYNCDAIKRIELPSSLDSIGSQAFYSCDNLTIVVSKIQTPFKINTNVFVNDGEKSSAVLYVPEGTTSAYQQYEGWIVFSEIIEGEPKEIAYEGLIYNYFENKGTATVIGRADETLRTIKIPGVVPVGNTNYSVTMIGNAAFQQCYIDTLVVNEGVEIIEKNAFRYNYSLRSVNLPKSLRTIGDEAFNNDYNFIELIIPEGVDSIGRSAFGSCSSIRKIEIPSTITRIGEQAFAYIENLTSVTSRIQNPFEISQSVFCRGWDWDYSDGTSKQIFRKSNANLYVPEGTSAEYQKYDGWNMFAGIYEGEIKEAVVDSLYYAYLMSSQTATVIASDDYSSYTAITIPATVTIDGVVYQVKEIGNGAFRDRYRLQNVTISEGIETIGKEAFQWCGSADFGTLPSSLRKIDQNAFYNCNNIKKLELPEGLQTVGEWAFGECYYLQKIVLPSSLTSIANCAFKNNSSLTAVISRIQSPFEIDKNVFGSENWNSETQQYEYVCAADLYVPEGTIEQYKRTEGWNVFLNIYEGELKEITYLGLAYTYNTSTKVATVVKGDNYSELKTVSIPVTILAEGTEYRVTTIGGRAFSSTSITSVEIADGIETISQEAFSNCEQLARLSLPSTLVTIGNSAFNYCRRLAGIKIPASVKTIGSNALSGCYNLESIEVEDGNETYESLGGNVIIERKTKALLLGCKNSTIPDGVQSIEAQAFNNCQIAKIQFPETVKSIGYNAFASCRYLTEVTLPEGLDSIAEGAFRNCEKLEMVEFPKTTKYFGDEAFYGCNSLLNVVSNVEEPKDIRESVFGYSYSNVYNQATLWVPKGKIDAYKRVEGWRRFNSYDELLRDILVKPTIEYNGRYLVMTNDTAQRAKIYYSTDGSEPTILYSDTVALSNLGTIQAISKRFGSYTVDTARYEITYVYDGVTARTARGGLLKNAFEWCGTDKIDMLDIDGQLNDDDFATIRGLSKLTILNMAASKIDGNAIPSGAFADMKLEWYVSPYNFTSVGSGIFKGCDKLAALTWNSSTIELPEDVVTDVANPNMLVYAKAQAMIPYAMRNVVVNGVANNIILVDSAGNNNFKCPEEFLARRITYTHDYQQKTELGQTQGWETLALPFTVSKITHETKGELTPSAVEGAERPFWLYELTDNGMEKAEQIRANTPYLICMPNDDAYGDDYILGGRVTFSASNVKITTSDGTTVSSGDRQFVPTYQRVASSSDVYALNVGQVVGENRIGSAFISNLREVRPFEAYSVHSGNKTRSIPVSSLGGGDATGINDLMLKNGGESLDGVVKVYSLSGALIKQGKREEVLRSLPKGLYIIDGKKIIK